jgi:ketosteroid isomerase-like protein
VRFSRKPDFTNPDDDRSDDGGVIRPAPIRIRIRRPDMRTGIAPGLLLAVASIVAAQQPAETPAAPLPSVQLPPELARVLTDYEAGWRAGDGAALARLFAEDGFVLPNGAPPVRGRAAIQRYYKGPGGPLALRAFAFATEGPVGYIIGGFSRQERQPDIGKFTLTLQKGSDGRWLIVSDMDNGNRPARRGPEPE